MSEHAPRMITITKPDDWHIHLRQDQALTTTVQHAAMQFNRVVVMPNCVPPITDVNSALKYQKHILAQVPSAYNSTFQPLLTLYLTDQTTSEMIKFASVDPNILGAKLYPQGATTNSSKGVTDILKIYHVLETMEKFNFPLLVHGEVTDTHVDIFDREAVFIDTVLMPIREKFPNLKIILEHITTKQAVDFVLNYNTHTAATITPHHLLLNRNDLLTNGLKPHYFCLPIIKDQQHQQAVISAALSGDARFFAGSDSAPHLRANKESSCCPAGIYHGPNTVLAYAEFFDLHKKLDKLEGFISFYGADFYKLPRNTSKIKLINKSFTVCDTYDYENGTIVPFWEGKVLNWSYCN